jgi:hypothetical protein
VFLSISCSSIIQSVLISWNTLPFYIRVLNMLNSTGGFSNSYHTMMRIPGKLQAAYHNDILLLKLHGKETNTNAFVSFVFRRIIFASLQTTTRHTTSTVRQSESSCHV